MLKRRDFMKSAGILVTSLLAGKLYSNEIQKPMESEKLSILDAIMKRRAVRHYTSDPVPEDHLQKMLEAGRMAATAGNQQPWKFIVTKDQAVIQKLKSACINNSMDAIKMRQGLTDAQLNAQLVKATDYYNKCFSATVYITVLTDNKSMYPSYNHWDGPLAAANIMIAARALGYGTVHYTDSVPSNVTKEVLNIPDNYERVCFMPIGVPVKWPETPMKKLYKSFIVNESF